MPKPILFDKIHRIKEINGRVEIHMVKDAVYNFLREHNHLAEQIDFDEERSRFFEHMQKGLLANSWPDGMQMIPTYLSVGELVRDQDQSVIVIDAGGTNFRICLLRFDQENNITIEHYKMFPMPGAAYEVSKETFYNIMADAVIPLLEYSSDIGFCFSYACEIQEDYDGLILNFSKEIKCPEAVGTLVGASLKEAIRKKGYEQNLHIVLLNDTVAALLGGYAIASKESHSSYAGFILGTGINIAYLEKASNIKKLPEHLQRDHWMIVNTEAGDYRIASNSVIDREVDESSQAPGTYLMEKKISGRYQGLQVYYSIKKAIEKNVLFSEAFAKGFSTLATLDSEDIDQFLRNPYGDNPLATICNSADEREMVYFLADNVIERAAILSTVIFAGIHMQTELGTSPILPIATTIDGSTFYKSKRFRHHFEYYVKKYLNTGLSYYQDYFKVENANLIGSAMAAIMNR